MALFYYRKNYTGVNYIKLLIYIIDDTSENIEIIKEDDKKTLGLSEESTLLKKTLLTIIPEEL